MIILLLVSYILAQPELPEAGFGTPTYIPDLGIAGPCIFVCLILFSCYPNPGMIDYQMALISVAGACLALYHMFLGSMGWLKPIILIPVAVCMGVLSFRKDTKVLALSVSNMYLGGYLVLMLLGVKYKVAGFPIMIVYGLVVYFLISTIKALFVNVIRSTSCTFFFLCFLAPITLGKLDTFDSMLSYSFYQFNVVRMLSVMITVTAFVFFFSLPIFVNVLLGKQKPSTEGKLEDAPEKDVNEAV